MATCHSLITAGVPRGLERQVQELEDSLIKTTSQIQELQDSTELSEKDRKGQVRILERKIEEAITISKTSIQAVQERAGGLEQRLQV